MRPGPAFPALWLFLLIGFVVLSGFAAAFDRFPADVWLAHRLRAVRPRLE